MKINARMRCSGGGVSGWLVAIMLLLTRVPALASAWDLAVLDRILSDAKSGEKAVRVGDMEIETVRLRAWRNALAGGPVTQSAFGGTATLWTGGNIYYSFSNNVSSAHQRATLDAMHEWETFASVRFMARTSQGNYSLISENPSLGGGGLSSVGMIGGQQILQLGPSAWDRSVLVHELGHTLGLVHEHQRSDRNSFVTIVTANIQPGQEGNFVLLGNSMNLGMYDFYSVMHYAHNLFSVNPDLDTIMPLPAYAQFRNIMGMQFDPVLSAADRAGMITRYGVATKALSSVITNTRDSGPGTLRAAIYYGLDHPGSTLTFNIPVNDPGNSNSVFNILLTGELPSVANGTVLDGSTEPLHPNPNGPSILLSGELVPAPEYYVHGIRLNGTNGMVRSLVINGFSGSGVAFIGTNSQGNKVAGCYIGVNPAGTMAVTNGSYPVEISSGAHNNTVGGTTAADRNIISGGAYQGLVIRDPGTSNNVVAGNYIGLNAAGTAALPNAYAGIALYAGVKGNVIGGSVTGARNVISGNGNQGMTIQDAGTDGNIVEGNYIGLNAAGTGAMPNQFAGISIFGGAKSNSVGVAGSGNVMSGNANQGLTISGSGTDGNKVEANYFGLNASGMAAVPNEYSGIAVYGGAKNNTVGGTTAGARNIISGNANQGIIIASAGTTGNVISGNYIGLNPQGSAAIPNVFDGVSIFDGATGNVIGGTSPGAGNVISGNLGDGVSFSDATTAGNLVQGNLLGLGASGMSAVPNGFSGVEMYLGARGNTVGGGVSARNYLSGNSFYGASLNDGANGNFVLGNYVGLNIIGQPAGNQFSGVVMFGGAVSNQIGGMGIGTGNVISANSSDGLQISDTSTSNNTVRANSVFGNAGGGIQVFNSSNRSQPAPSITSAVLGTGTTIGGTASGPASTMLHLDFYVNPAPANFAEAQTYLGSKDVTTTAGGTASYSATFAPVQAGLAITATATDAAGNTSSSSSGFTVTTTSTVGDGISDAWRSAHFGGNGTTTNSQSCAACDPDGDRMSNYQEFFAATDPILSGSSLRVSKLVKLGNDVRLDMLTVSGIVYRLEYRNDLASGNWYPLLDQFLGTGSTISVTNLGVSGMPQRYYRLGVVP